MDLSRHLGVGIFDLTKRSSRLDFSNYCCILETLTVYMDIKTAFLNSNLEEDIYMQQPEWFVVDRKGNLVCKLQKSIYRLKQASRSWNSRFDQAVKSFGFIQNPDEPCVYKKYEGKVVSFLLLHVHDILLIGNDVAVLSTVKAWLASTFDMKDLGEASYILEISSSWIESEG